MELTVPLAALSFGGADVGTLLDKNAQREGSASLFPLYHYYEEVRWASVVRRSLDWLLNNVLKSMS